MKACPVCGRLYPPDAGFCPADGQQLYSATQVPVAGDQNDPRIGQMLGERYQVRRVVADGGMGRVYEALDLVDRRNLALKVLHADVAKDDVSVERFKREFEISKLLPHQHIVEVLDFKPTHDGSYVLVMEFLYGEELRNTLKREKVMPPERVVRMLSQVAIALDEAHARKLVHRDLKPDNLFLCQTSEGDIVKLLDFGSVKDKSDPSKKLTVLGTTIGSPFYMAPEQAQGLDTLDHRADVWALAAIAYECVAGQVPFKGNNGPSILLEILTKEPQPVSVTGKGQKFPIPPTLDRVLAHAFKKAPGMRIASVGALADAVGGAYGLEGTHLAWAATPQQELGARINAKLPALMQAVPAGKPADALADGFFGENDALGFDAPPGAGQTAPIAPAAAPMPGFAPAPQPYPPPPYSAASQAWTDPQGVPGVPKNSLGWLVAVLVGGVALLIGIVVVLVVFR